MVTFAWEGVEHILHVARLGPKIFNTLCAMERKGRICWRSARPWHEIFNILNKISPMHKSHAVGFFRRLR